MGRQVFLMCVGGSDPYVSKPDPVSAKRRPVDIKEAYDPVRHDEGPILSFFTDLGERRPKEARAYLFSTPTGVNVRAGTETEPRGELTANLLRRRYAGWHIIHRCLADIQPNDHQAVLEEMRAKVGDVVSELGGEDIECMAYTEPGTPAMQTAWLVLVHQGLLRARLLRREPGRPPKEISVVPLFEADLIGRALAFFEAYDFLAADRLLRELAQKALSPKRRTAADAAAALCNAYWCWATFRYDGATWGVKRAADVLQEMGGQLARVVQRQRDTLLTLQKIEELGATKAMDIWHGARRHHAAERHTESLLLCHAVFEQIALLKAVEAVGRQIGAEVDAADFRASLKTAARTSNRRRVEVFVTSYFPPPAGVNDVYANTPAWLGAEAARRLAVSIPPGFRFAEGVEWLTERRNDALHRLDVIRREEAERAIEVARETVLAAFGPAAEDDLDNYSFSPEAVATLRHGLATLL